MPNKRSPLVDPPVAAVAAVFKAVVDFLLRSPSVEGDEGVEGEGGEGEPRWSGARRASIGVGVAVRDGGCRAGAIRYAIQYSSVRV